MLSLLLFVIMPKSLKVHNVVEIHILESLKVNCSNNAFSSSSQLVFDKHFNMTSSSAEKHYSVVLNVKAITKKLDSKHFQI